MQQDIRWKQRFQNFDRAVTLLREPIDRGVDALSDLEKEGTIQRSELAFELGWKTLKDFLEFEGRSIQPLTPRAVLKEAYAANVLTDGQVWIDMLDHRNALSHTYDSQEFDSAVRAIERRYMTALDQLRSWLRERVSS